MTLNPKQFGQQQLFDPGPAVEQHPGDMHPDKWAARPDVQYHGGDFHNFGGDEISDATSHWGTKAAATHIANERERTQGYPDGLYQRRLHGFPKDGSTVYDDHDANTGDMAYRLSKGADISSSLDASGDIEAAEEISRGNIIPDGDAAGVFEELHEGRSVAYDNGHEDEGSVSYVVPHGRHSSYADDLMSSPNRPAHIKEWARGAYDYREFGEREFVQTPTFVDHLNEQWLDVPMGQPEKAAGIKRTIGSWTRAGAKLPDGSRGVWSR